MHRNQDKGRRRPRVAVRVSVRLDALELLDRCAALVARAWDSIARVVRPACVVPWDDVPIGAAVITRDKPPSDGCRGRDRVLLRTSPDRGVFVGVADHETGRVDVDDDLAMVESESWSGLRARRGTDLVLVAARRVPPDCTADDLCFRVGRGLSRARERGAS